MAPEQVVFRDYKSGNALHSIPLGQEYLARYGSPYFHVHRSDLQLLLVEELLLEPGSLKLGTAVVGYEEGEQGVCLQLSNRETLEGDLLIGADGIRSTIRQQLQAGSSTSFSGQVAWRGVVDTKHLPKGWMGKEVSNYVGPGKHMVLYYLRQQQLANFVGVVENHAWTNDSWVEASPWEELASDFAGWHPTVEAILNAVDKDKCYRWALHNQAPLTNWSSKRVTLLGDSAHATLPFMASGAALAIEDARILQRAIDQAESIPAGLELLPTQPHTAHQQGAKIVRAIG